MRRLFWVLILFGLIGTVAGAVLATLNMTGDFTVLSLSLGCNPSPCGTLHFGSVTAGGAATTQTFTLVNTSPAGTPVLTIAYTVTAPTGITLTLTIAGGASLNGATLGPGTNTLVTATLSATSTATSGAGTLSWIITGSA